MWFIKIKETGRLSQRHAIARNNSVATDAGNYVITSAERIPEMEIVDISKGHVRPSLRCHFLLTLLLLLTVMASRSFALSGEYVNEQLTHILFLVRRVM